MVMNPSVVMSPLVDMLSLLTANGYDAAMNGYEILVVVCAGYEPYHGYDLEVTNEQDFEGEL